MNRRPAASLEGGYGTADAWRSFARSRLLFVVTTLGADGGSRTVAALVSRLAGTYDVRLCSLTSVSRDVLADGPVDRLDVIELGMRRSWDVRVWKDLASLCRHWRPAVVHTQLSRADWYGRLAAATAGVPVVASTIQNLHWRMYAAEFTPIKAAVGRFLDRVTERLTSCVVAVSQGVRDDLVARGVPPAKVRVIANGIDLRRCASVLPRDDVRRGWHVGPGEFVVGTTALLKPQKGIGDLLEAAHLVVPRLPHARFLVFGGGPEQRPLEAQIAALGLSRHVRLLGWIPEAMRHLRGLDLFVLPSRWEGLPVALLEAMAVGLPCVATRVSGVSDVITHGETGWLVEPARPQDLAAAIGHLANDDNLRARLASAGRAHVGQHFSAEQMVRAYDALYRELMDGRPGTRTSAR